MPEDWLLELPDVNVLVAMTNPAHVHHKVALEWFTGTAAFATTPITETGLVRLVLNPAVMGTAIDAETALAVLRSVRGDARHQFIADGSSLADAHVGLEGLRGHQQVSDLHLLNLAAANRAKLVTFDRKLAFTVPTGRGIGLTVL